MNIKGWVNLRPGAWHQAAWPATRPRNNMNARCRAPTARYQTKMLASADPKQWTLDAYAVQSLWCN
eukprot:5289158-Pyramimonas_sp.AAC.1